MSTTAQTKAQATREAVAEFLRIQSIEFDGLEKSGHYDSIFFTGPRSHFIASGLVPGGTLFPDECNAKRGVRWRDRHEHRFVLTKGWGPEGSFRLTIYATPDGKRHLDHTANVKREMERLDAEIASLDVKESTYRREMVGIVLMGWSAGKPLLSSGRAWSFSPEVIEAVHEHAAQIQELLMHGEVTPRPETIKPLKTRRAMLGDPGLQGLIGSLTMTKQRALS